MWRGDCSLCFQKLRFGHQGTKNSSRRAGGNTDREALGGGSGYVTTGLGGIEESERY